jgi:DNA-binding SARP family transcriptional activator/tetratricopeptide (TPR) repeat protein
MEVWSDGPALHLAGVKQRAVLAMLLLEPNALVPLDRLIGGLWGEEPPSSAVNTLQSYMSRLRRALASGFLADRAPSLRGGPLGYTLGVDPATIDAAEFVRLTAFGRSAIATEDVVGGLAALRQGLSLWRGAALADFTGLPFADREAPHLEEMRVVAWEAVADAELDLGRHEGLVPELARLVSEQPLRERLREQLMLALYRCGRQADALGVYRDTRRLLAEELGIDPSPTLQRLHERLLAQDPEIEKAAAGAPLRLTAAVDPGQDVFVGREHELAVLTAALRDTAGGHGRLVLLVGDAGLGKTALVQRFLRDVHGAPCTGRCWEDEGAPAFWPWAQIVRCRLERREPRDGAPNPAARVSSDLADLVTSAGLLRADELPADLGQARFRLFEVVTELLTHGDPGIVVLEDIHAADAPSLLLLQFLVRQLQETGLLVLATLRPPPRGSGERLTGVLAELVREPHTIRLELPPLTDGAVQRFLEQAAGRPVSDQLMAVIRRWAEGNPFFLTELVRLLRTEDRLHRPAQWSEELLEIPQSIQEMVRRRLAALPDDAVGALMAAAVAGPRFSVALLERIGAGPAGGIAAAIEAAEAARLVEETPDGSGEYRFSHALVRQTLYSWVGSTRRRRLHALTAEALEDVGPGGPHPAQLAHHLVAAATESAAGRAADAAVRAADQAMRQFAYEEAARLYSLALDALEVSGAAEHRLTTVLLPLGNAQVLSGDVPAARTTFLRVADLARREGRAAELAEAALRLGAAFEARAHDEELIGLLTEALAALPEEQTALRARLLARLAMALYFAVPLSERARLSDQALQLARASGDSTALAAALNARYFASWGPALAGRRMAAAAELLEHAEGMADRGLILDALVWLSWELLERGDWSEADALLARHAAVADQLRHPLHRSYAATWRATRATLDGRFADAEVAAHRAFVLGQHLTELAYPRFNLQRFLILREQGRLEELQPDIDATARANPHLPGWQTVAALARLDQGDPTPGREVLARFSATRSVPPDGNWLFGTAQLAELACELDDRDAAAALYEQLLPFDGRCAVARFAPGCVGAVARHLGLLSTLREDWTRAAEHFAAAQDMHDRLGARPLSAWTHYDTARMLQARAGTGDWERVEAALRAARATAVALGMNRLVERIRAAEQGPRTTSPSAAPAG